MFCHIVSFLLLLLMLLFLFCHSIVAAIGIVVVDAALFVDGVGIVATTLVVL